MSLEIVEMSGVLVAATLGLVYIGLVWTSERKYEGYVRDARSGGARSAASAVRLPR